jgi:DNA ligase-1
MLAKKLTPKKLQKLLRTGSVLFVQPKLNGIRAVWDGETLWSRTGKLAFSVSCAHIIEELKRRGLPPGLDGEVYSHGTPLQKISGDVRQQKTPIDYLQFYVFDHISKRPFSTRQKELDTLEIPRQDSLLQQVPTFNTREITHKENFINLMYENFLSDGFEGLILRLDKPYNFGKKENFMYKMKPEKDMDLVLVNFNPATTALHKDTFGSLQLWHPIEGWEVACSGLTEAKRRELWQKREELIGMTVEIKYEELSEDGKPLRLKFSRLRWDK